MSNQKIIIFTKVNDLQRFCAKQFIKQVIKKPDSRIGFATGSSSLEAYRMVVADHKQNGTSWKDVYAFNLDEFIAIEPNHPQSFRKQMTNNLFSQIDIKPENIHIPNSQAQDTHKEAMRYEKTLRNKGPIDFQYISLGVNGHMAYNEPGTPLDSLTHVTTLAPETIDDIVNKKRFASVSKAPKQAITMGVRTLLEVTKKIMMVSYGKHKAEVTRIMLEEKPSSKVTASALQTHPNCFYVLDSAAASKLSPVTLERAEYR